MKLTDLIRAEKGAVSQSEWRDDPPKKRDFPLLLKKGGAFPLTKKWRWMVTTFEAAGRTFAVLVAYHREVPEYQAVLAERVGSDSRIISRLEYHGNHPIVGWHVHAVCDDFDDLGTGSVKPLGQRRIPTAYDHHRRGAYCLYADSMSDNIALAIAMERYGVPYQGDLLATPDVP